MEKRLLENFLSHLASRQSVLIPTECSSVLSLEGEAVPRRSTISPNNSKFEEAKGKSRKAMKSSKRWITERIGDLDKLR
ncbi:hypothetical protein H5410_041121 [Solanum commersonii]|uniref:Uncharacterized protein n=1 Tax=Solanum commersonii TaxID=4109 RepID=A0A9J5XSS2_SOLCO|nr:hypothetical protein H5410_041121 [Solanum commersonii]